MNREKIFSYVKAKYHTVEEQPWQKFPKYSVLRHQDNTKWYGIVMNVLPKNIGLVGDKEVDIIDLKCDPDLIHSMIDNIVFFPAYHMNKDHWISVLISQNVPEKTLFDLIDKSYELTL